MAVVCIFPSVAEERDDEGWFTFFSGKEEDALPFLTNAVETLAEDGKKCGASFQLKKDIRSSKNEIAWRITGQAGGNKITFKLINDLYTFENASRYDTVYTICYLLSSFFAYSEPAKALGYEMTISWDDENFTDGKAAIIDRNNFRHYRKNVIGEKLVHLMLSGGLNPTNGELEATPVPSPSATPVHHGYRERTPKLTDTPAPTPPPTSLPFAGYKKGDRNVVIGQIKARLQELGYYVHGAKCDNEFNSTMVERIKMFQENNGLKESGEADLQTIKVLFSSSAVGTKKFATPAPKPTSTPYVEPKYLLVETEYADWGKYNNGELWIEIEVENISKMRTVDGFTVSFYAEDVYRNRMKYNGKSDTVEYTYNLTVKPKKKEYTDRIRLPGYSNAKWLFCAIVKIHTTSGVTINVPEDDQKWWHFEY